MDVTKNYRAGTIITEVIMLLVGLLFLVPFYFLFVNSVKSFGDLLTSAASLPKSIEWGNYARAFEITRFPEAFLNSAVITIASNVLLVLISAMAAYKMVRRDSKFNRVLFVLFVAAMVVPFQSIMIPLVKVTSTLGLMNSIPGLIVCYLGFGVPMSVFLFHGFVKSIPLEIEEAATVDGSNAYGVFFRVVLPLMKPMLVTVFILNTLWIWNDYLLPSLMLQSQDLRTIPIATFAFFGQYTKQWDLALPALVMGILPVIVFFLSMQKYIIEGITAGAVKG
ncbi:sugar ABC transporter permease [Paenibacillus selenitireducens]|jgi:raffinose/stachyose/melibiose transport system permease protein|uniref:Sugar ABC transporter permease n=1 Tax=Paenibacillus selenitireducens TaxID=1324314 RepID=A0A1T2X8C4_9BACL|nr:carbohydrate ABC transporter permease [Paenibacillus selenitireducens]OPA76127.1 sugar ABC transporter permease [Paenibacillus selenitireducens]